MADCFLVLDDVAADAVGQMVAWALEVRRTAPDVAQGGPTAAAAWRALPEIARALDVARMGPQGGEGEQIASLLLTMGRMAEGKSHVMVAVLETLMVETLLMCGGPNAQTLLQLVRDDVARDLEEVALRRAEARGAA